MLDARHDLSFCCIIGSKLVGDHQTRRTALALQQLPHQELCRFGIAAALYENPQDKPVVINGALQPMLRTSDRYYGFVETPFISEPSRRSTSDLIGEGSPEFLRPQPDRLMQDDDTSGRQHILDHPQAQRKAEIQPHRVGDDFSRIAVAAVERILIGHGRTLLIKVQTWLS